MSHQTLEQLFEKCDTNGNGYIDREEFCQLCAGFQIGNEDADAFFDDLDHDGDGRVSFEDFRFGFRDFLTPGAKRGSAQLTNLAASSSPATPKTRAPSFKFDSRMDSLVEFEAKQHAMEQKHSRARHAWRHLADNLSKDDIKKFLGVR